MEYKVIHNESQNQIEALADDAKQIGLIDYHLHDGIISITHTEVNPAYEGQGIAGQMTKVILTYAAEKQYKVRSICPYTETYIERHPEYQHLL